MPCFKFFLFRGPAFPKLPDSRSILGFLLIQIISAHLNYPYIEQGNAHCHQPINRRVR